MQVRAFSRRTFVAGLAGAAAIAAMPTTRASVPPLRQSRILVGFPPGGMPDIIARRVAETLTDRYAKAVVVDNRAGAGGQLAIQQLRGIPADGTSLLLTPGSMLSIYPHTYKRLAYDPIADLSPVTLVGYVVPALAVGPQVPASVTDVRGFIQWIKANASLASYGSPAAGSVLHFAGLMFANEAGIELQHVPYRGTQPALVDLLGGRVPALISTQGEFLAHKKAGSLRVLAVASDKRSSALPDVPTFAEQGFPTVIASDYVGFYLPSGAARDVTENAHAHLRAALATDPVRAALADTGIEPGNSSPQQLGALVRDELARWAPIVKRSGFTADA